MYRLLIVPVSILFIFTVCPSTAAAESGGIVIQASKFPDGGFQRIPATETLILDAREFLYFNYLSTTI